MKDSKFVEVIISFLQNLSYVSVVIIALLLGSYYYFNGYDDGSQLKAQIIQNSDLILQAEGKKRETEKLLAEEDQLKREVGELADKFKTVSSKLPINLKRNEITDTIYQFAKSSGCHVVNIKPGEETERELYIEMPVQIEMRGAFSNLVVFMYYLSTLERITHTTGVTFANFNSAYDGNLKLTTSVISFRFRQPDDPKSDELKPLPRENQKGGV